MTDETAAGPDRDLIGYGRAGLRVRWPGDARVAVSLCVNYEEGSERSYWAGDGVNEPPNELAYAAPPIRDLANESMFEYGSRAGIWRLTRIFDAHDIKVTFFGCAMAFELNPGVAGYVREAGHEVCCHGWRWEDVSRLEREIEREHMLRAISSIERTCGERPRGWYCKAPPSLHTRELLVEEGGFAYDSDSFADDLPYHVQVLGRRHLVIPYTFVVNDSKFIPGHEFSGPSSFLDICVRAFDELWDEGATHPKMLSVGLHPRWIGQPGRAAVLREFIEHCRDRGAVWFARRIDIAEWWEAHHGEFGAAS
jgi:peptidoglycan/xylan/chitin deacetylase (PgdA/CDA1 family)